MVSFADHYWSYFYIGIFDVLPTLITDSYPYVPYMHVCTYISMYGMYGGTYTFNCTQPIKGKYILFLGDYIYNVHLCDVELYSPVGQYTFM